jgi:hypothetical protein
MGRIETPAARWRPALGLAIGGVAILANVIGTSLMLAASDDALRRIGSYVTPGTEADIGALGVTACTALVVAIGSLLCLRLSGNLVGWLILVAGGLMSMGNVAQGYLLVGFGTREVAIPGVEIAAWIGNAVWGPAIVALGGALFVFPSGRAVSRAWARLFVAALAVSTAAIVAVALIPGELALTTAVRNPFGVAALAAFPAEVVYLAFLSVAVPPFLGAGAMVARYRHGSEVERLQLRWVAAAAITFASTFVALAVLSVANTPAAGSVANSWSAASDVAFFTALATVPLAIGIAILRYRLYAIDLIIRRTLVYGALTAVLGAGYAGGVIVLQAVLRPVTGQDTPAVAGATLLVAAAFRPLRGRIQTAIDRRFYRVHYDAARMTTSFSARVGQEVDLEVIEADFAGAVVDAVQPARVGVWRRWVGP